MASFGFKWYKDVVPTNSDTFVFAIQQLFNKSTPFYPGYKNERPFSYERAEELSPERRLLYLAMVFYAEASLQEYTEVFNRIRVGATPFMRALGLWGLETIHFVRRVRLRFNEESRAELKKHPNEYPDGLKHYYRVCRLFMNETSVKTLRPPSHRVVYRPSPWSLSGSRGASEMVLHPNDTTNVEKYARLADITTFITPEIRSLNSTRILKAAREFSEYDLKLKGIRTLQVLLSDDLQEELLNIAEAPHIEYFGVDIDPDQISPFACVFLGAKAAFDAIRKLEQTRLTPIPEELRLSELESAACGEDRDVPTSVFTHHCTILTFEEYPALREFYHVGHAEQFPMQVSIGFRTILPDNTSRFFSTSVVYNPNPFPTSCPVYPPYVYAKMEKPFSRPRQEIKPSGTPRVFADEAYEELHRGRDDGEVDLLNQELLAIQQGEASSDNETN